MKTQLEERIDSYPYWFHRIDLGNGVVTPGWSDPVSVPEPHYGVPHNLDGLRVLDVGCAEGAFSFLCEQRGAAEVVSVDAHADYVERFNLCAEVLGSKIRAQVIDCYDLDPKTLGTFDLVLFYGVLYHLRSPLIGLERVAAMTHDRLIVGSRTFETQSHLPLARFHTQGVLSGPKSARVMDTTVVWEPNAACLREMLAHLGMVDIERIGSDYDPGRRARLLRALRPHKEWTSAAQFRARKP